MESGLFPSNNPFASCFIIQLPLSFFTVYTPLPLFEINTLENTVLFLHPTYFNMDVENLDTAKAENFKTCTEEQDQCLLANTYQ